MQCKIGLGKMSKYIEHFPHALSTHCTGSLAKSVQRCDNVLILTIMYILYFGFVALVKSSPHLDKKPPPFPLKVRCGRRRLSKNELIRFVRSVVCMPADTVVPPAMSSSSASSTHRHLQRHWYSSPSSMWVCLETLNTQRDSSKRGQS